MLEPLPFPGRPDRLVDDTNLGKYFFEVRDLATQKVLYSRGFASIFGEWELTEEARKAHRTFSESVRFPAPAAPVQLVLKKRDAERTFREVWSLVVDPTRPVRRRRAPTVAGTGDPLCRTRAIPRRSSTYSSSATATPRGIARSSRRTPAASWRCSSGTSRSGRGAGDFNVWGLCPPTEERGVSRPLTGVHRRTRLGATYDAFGSERYVLSFENRSLRDVASFAPYDALAILVNAETYGGGGIFNLYATVAADNRWAGYIFVHELGHSLAALADEYFTSETAYLSSEARPEPWEPNVTADPRAQKWKDLQSPGVPLPTPWPKDEFTRRAKAFQEQRKAIRARNGPESEMDALFLAQQKEETALLSAAPNAAKVGAFEGANYEASGYYRPQLDCVMFTRDPVPFCAVCRRALSKVIDLYAAPRGRRCGKERSDARGHRA